MVKNGQKWQKWNPGLVCFVEGKWKALSPPFWPKIERNGFFKAFGSVLTECPSTFLLLAMPSPPGGVVLDNFGVLAQAPSPMGQASL